MRSWAKRILSYLLIALMALSTAMTMTPTSAKMPSHIFAKPTATSARQPNLTAREKIMFCFTIEMHLREMAMAFAMSIQEMRLFIYCSH